MNRLTALSLVAAVPLVLTACDLAPKHSAQNGPRGTGMNQITLANAPKAEVPPPPYPLTSTAGPTAAQTYQNVQVLGDISAEEFNYTMAAITAWVSPKEGCNYCHNPENMASDEVYTKKVARQMLAMTRTLNANWKSHVGQTGVTCWTCHRGNAVPTNYWTQDQTAKTKGFAALRRGDNMPTDNSAYTSLPGNFAALYLASPADAAKIKVSSATIHPTPDNTTTTMGAEGTYGLMNHMSQALGVNCTFCHNTQAFRAWNLSTPQRATAWHGLRMVGTINAEHITPLKPVFPANRLGPAGDPFKANCATCHQGQNKPLGGVPMAKDYPALLKPLATAPAAAAPAGAPVPAASAPATM